MRSWLMNLGVNQEVVTVYAAQWSVLLSEWQVIHQVLNNIGMVIYAAQISVY